jgi:hypothetical protein
MLLCFCGANGQPTIARKAVAVGGSENRVVAAASYEARKFEFDLRLVALWPRSFLVYF